MLTPYFEILFAIWHAKIFVAMSAAENSVKFVPCDVDISLISAPIILAPLAENNDSIISIAPQ